MQLGGWNSFASSLDDELDDAFDSKASKSKGQDFSDDELDFETNANEERVAQNYDFILILDFEACRQWAGKDPDDDEWLVEITEFPIEEFHRYCKPTLIEENILNAYVAGKYGDRFGLSEEWHAKARPIHELLEELHQWLVDKGLIAQDGTALKSFTFLTCGDWDLKNALPRNLDRLGLAVPSYMQEWINIKVAFGTFYKRRRNPAGMTEMLKELGLKLEGHHHMGLHDCRNISRIAICMMQDGWVAEPTKNIKGQTTEERNASWERKKKERREQGKGYLSKRKKNGICSYWLRGACNRGDGCRFAHEK